MIISRSPVILLACLVAAAGTAHCQDFPGHESSVMSKSKFNKHRVGFSYRAGFNIDARFQSLGSDSGANPGPATGGVAHTYDDGYVLVDVSGNAGGQTWNWGYENSSQIRGNHIFFSASNPGPLSGDVDNNPQHGFEVTYACQISEPARLRWGIETAFNYTDLTFRDRSLAEATGTVDAYALGAITPPLAPYAGTFAGPGVLISDTPTRLPVTALSKLDASLYALKLGPYLTIPICKCLDVTFSGGLVLAVIDADFSYYQTAAFSPSAVWHDSSRSTGADVLVGGYLGSTLDWNLNESLGIFAAINFQSAGKYSLSAGDKRATVDLGQSIFIAGGVSLSF